MLLLSDARTNGETWKYTTRKPADDYKNLRKEVTSLKQSNSKLTKELGDLKKRFDAALGDKKTSKKEITEKK